MALNLRHQTAGEFAARFWAQVRQAEKLEFSRLMYWLERKLVSGDITDAQARGSFNAAFNRTINATQWTVLRTNRIKPAHDRYASMLAEGDL